MLICILRFRGCGSKESVARWLCESSNQTKEVVEDRKVKNKLCVCDKVVWKMVCDKERWCVWQSCVWKMLCERWCVTKRRRRRRRGRRRRDTESKTRTPHKDAGEKKNCQETPRMNDEIPTLMLGFIEKPQGWTLQVEKMVVNWKWKTQNDFTSYMSTLDSCWPVVECKASPPSDLCLTMGAHSGHDEQFIEFP